MILKGLQKNNKNISTQVLTELKMENHLLSKSEIYFFNDERTLKKNYLKPLSKKEL